MSPIFRLARVLALGLCLAAPARAQQTASFPPNDPRITYSDYACAHLSEERASFDRELAASWLCDQEQMSPGVRASFVVDASHISFDFHYTMAGFFCGYGTLTALSWEFGLIVDGQRRPTGSRNPLYPLSKGNTPWIHLGSGSGPHNVTLVWPSAADVDLVRVSLRETRDASVPQLLQAPPRNAPQLTIFGDSISHGLDASHVLNTYPSRLGMLKDWRIVNLGYSGRTTQPTDAWLAAGVSPCPDGLASAPPDRLLLEIGSNDYHIFNDVFTRIEKFEQRYRDWLDEFRALRPITPILVLTMLPRGDECQIQKRFLENYRQKVREIVEERLDPNIYVFEGRDLIAMPPLAGDPLYDAMLLHPSDLGIEQIVERLGLFNLVRNPGFELRPLAGCGEVPEPEPYLWTNLGTAPSPATAGNGGRVLAITSGGLRAQSVYGLSAGDRFELRASGTLSTAGQAGRVALEFLDARGKPVADPAVISFNQTSWRRLRRQSTAPIGTVQARLTISKGPGAGQFLVDDLELTLVGL
jgi:lysophospholipase L1-like esterase